MAKPWSAVAESPQFKALPAAEQEIARRQYFDEVVVPKVPEEELETVRAQFDADTRIVKQDLPAGMEPSTAGAGRGSVNPPTVAERTDDMSRPSFRMPSPAGNRRIEPARKKVSVLEGMDIPDPVVTPQAEAENVRLSRRDYAEATPEVTAPPRTVARQGGAMPRRNRATDLGADVGEDGFAARALGKAAASAAEGAYGALRAGAEQVGADKVAEFAQRSGQAAGDFQQGMGKPQLPAGFGPNSPLPYLQEQAEGAASSLGQSATYALAFGPRAVIPLLSLQSAGSQYQAARQAGKTPGEALANAIPYGTFEAIGEKFQGLDKAAKALHTIASGRATRQELQAAGQALVNAGVREIPGEIVTYLGQTGVDLLPGIGIRQDLTMSQFLDGLRDTVVQSAIMGGAMGAGGAAARTGTGVPRQPSAEELARQKGFLARQERIKQLSSSGEKEVAAVLQRRLDTEQAEGELQALADKPYAADPDFQQRFRALRSQGVKPAEASARAAMFSGFANIGAQAGLTPKAIERAVVEAAKMPLDEVPGFLERYAAGLNQGGMGQPVPQGTVSGAVGALGDDAMNTAIDNIASLLGVQAKPETAGGAGAPAAAAVSQTEPAVSPIEAPVTPEGVIVTPEAPAAHAAATSPLNDLPEPTEAQKAAGNYKVGRLRIAGLDISVENPQGSTRRGTDADGNAWETPMQDHYGYVRGTTAADGDKLDVFVKPGTPEDYRGPVFVVDQIDPRTGRFDEHKVVLGAASQAEAEALYRRNYSADWQGLGAITQLPMPAFRSWAESKRTKEPLGDLPETPAAATAASQQPAAAAPAAAAAPPADRARAAPAGGPAGTGELGAAADRAGAASAAAVGRREQAEAVLQNRNRATPSSIAQMRSIAAAPDYGRLGFSRDFANGAPVVAGGTVPEAQLGREDVAVAADGRRIPVRYAVVDAGKVLPSHSVDGSPSAGYGAAGAMLAIAGNGRIAGLQAAYRGRTATPYRKELLADTLHGVERAVIEAMSAPVLVRVMSQQDVTADIGDVSNTSGNLNLSAVEQASNDARRVELEALSFGEDGAVTAEAVRQFVRAMPQAEQGALLDTNGQPTRQAIDRLNAAVFWRAYGNEQLVRLYAQAQDPEARLVLSALAQVAPKMARLDGAGDLDFRPIVADAAQIAVNARRDGISIARAAAQADLDADPAVRVVLDLFASSPRSTKPVVEALSRAADFAYTESTKPAEDMFGAVPRASRQDAIERIERDDTARPQDLEQPARGQVAGQDAQGRDAGRGRAQDGRGAEEVRPAEARDAAEVAEPQASYGGATEPTEDLAGPAPSQRQQQTQAEKARRASQEQQQRSGAPDPADFTLTGSDRPADEAEARGQERLFEPQTDYAGAYETDLFGNPIPRQQSLPDAGRAGRARAEPDGSAVRGDVQPAAAVRRGQRQLHAGDAAQDAPGDFYVDTYVATPVQRTLGARAIKTPADLAAATRYLHRSAVERFDAIVTDKAGKPLAVVGSFKGAVSQTSVYPATVMAEAIRVPGAAQIWFSHNHPSGNPNLSEADKRLNTNMTEVFRGTGIEPMGLIAVGSEKFGYHSVEHKQFPRESGLNHPIPSAQGSIEVPVYEREQRDERVVPRVIGSPLDAKQVAREFYSQAKVPGMLLLDAQNHVSGWVPLDGLLQGKLRGTGGLAALYKAASRGNFNGIIFVHAGELDVKKAELEDQDAVENIGAALAAVDVRVLDAINVNHPGAPGGMLSRAERGLRLVGHTAYARSPASAERRGPPGSYEEALAQVRARRGLSRDAVQKIVDKLTAKWKNGPRISVVAHVSQLPGKHPPGTRGLYTRGHIYIVAGEHRNEGDVVRSVARTLAHEAGAHFGLRHMLGRDAWKRFMANIQRAIAQGNKPLTEIQKYVRETYVDEASGEFNLSEQEEADEIAAKAIEEAIDEDGNFRPGFGFFKEVWARVAQFLRDLGLDFKFTNAELQGVLLMSMRNLETGRRKLGPSMQLAVAAAKEDGPMRHRAFHGSPHDFDEFQIDKIGTGEGAQAYGWGLYFAENPEVAHEYRRTLSNRDQAGYASAHLNAQNVVARFNGDAQWAAEVVREQIDAVAEKDPNRERLEQTLKFIESGEYAKPLPERGSVYQVDIPDSVVAKMLLWDKPLSEQPEAVRKALAGARTSTSFDEVTRGRTVAQLLAWVDAFDPNNSYGEWIDEFAPETTADELRKLLREEYADSDMGAYLSSSTFEDHRTGASIYKEIAAKKGSDAAASKYLESLGVPGIRYLDGGSRNRPLRQVKKEFLAQLPEDADFDEVTDLIGTGAFSPQNEAILKALAADDWLGFDYPAQALSAALSSDISGYDASPALLKAIEDAQQDATYNLVVFNDKHVTITHKDGSPVTKKERDAFLDGTQEARGDNAAMTADVLPDDVDDASTLPIPDRFGGLPTAGRLFHGGRWDGARADKQGVIVNGVPATSFTRSPMEALEFASHVQGDVVSIEAKGLRLYAGGDAKLDAAVRGGKFDAVAAAGYDGADLRALLGTGYNEVVVWTREKMAGAMKASASTVPGGYGLTSGFAPAADAFDSDGMNARGTDPTDTPEFKRWFKGSKVVDAEGKPLVVYHETSADFSEFNTDSGQLGSHFGTAEQARGMARIKRNNDAPRTIAVYLSIQNPLRLKDHGSFGPGFVRLQLKELGIPVADRGDPKQSIIDAGYDGVVYANEREGDGDSWIVFRPEQIKSAIGNRGTFDEFDADIRHARGARTTPQAGAPAAAAATIPRPLSRWRDPTGRVQFGAGQALYDLMGKAADPMLQKLQLKAASKPMARALRQMRVDVARAQETAAAVAKEANKLSAAERVMVSDLVEGELAAGTVPPQHAVRMATLVNDTMGRQTAELVRLGMLSQESADRWIGHYLPRYYESKLTRRAADAWSEALRKMRGRPRVMKGIRGKHLRGRGLYETIPEAELQDWIDQGWEVRDPDYPPGGPSEDGTVQVWRDFTRAERDDMGEIRDVGFRFVMGYMETQKDIALGRMFEALAGNPEISSRTATDKLTVRVPTSIVEGTGARTYGKLAGRFVAPETLSHLSAIEEAQSDAMRMYRKALSWWKLGKTAMNPVSHVNNVLSNVTMAHFAGVSYWDQHKYAAAILDLATGADMVKEAKEAGLFIGTISDAELAAMLPKELRALARTQEGLAPKVGRGVFDLMTFFLRRPMGAAYQAEDLFFRYLIYRDARKRGTEPADAVDYAQKFIFTYDDLPKGARRIRDFAIPFFSYTYKATPALLHTALTHPWRFAAPAAVLWGANAMAYAIAAGDDDDEWMDVLQQYLTDPEFRKKAREQEELEREHLPPWMKGTSALGTPKAIRLGMDETTKLPLFIDVARIIPGGDLFDVSPNAGGIPLPQPLTPSHPLFTTAVAMIANKDTWSGKELTDKNDTAEEKARKRGDWIWKQVAPAVAAGGYHWHRGMNALAQATGEELTWVPDILGGDATGIGRDGLPVQPKFAAMQTFGLKVRPIDIERSIEIEEGQRKSMIRSIDAEMRTLKRLYNAGVIKDRVYDKAQEMADTKKERLQEGLTVDGEKKD